MAYVEGLYLRLVGVLTGIQRRGGRSLDEQMVVLGIVVVFGQVDCQRERKEWI